MDMMITSIKISRVVRQAARIRADELKQTFQAYYEDLILKDIKANRPDLWEELLEGKELNVDRKRPETILKKEIERVKAEKAKKAKEAML